MDNRIHSILDKEVDRQASTIELIASENFASSSVMALSGSVFTNKYAEGYPGNRYYNGCDQMDEIETLAIEQLKELYGCEFANVQPHCGANANTAVYQAFLKPGDKILGMDLASGGHLSHGSPPNISGKIYDAYTYGVDEITGLLDYSAIMAQAKEVQPKMIVAGASAYPRSIDWSLFREIANSVGAMLLVDMAHYSGLIAGDAYPSPLPYADIVTSTTHKTLRGPRGGIILWNNPDYSKRINGAIFPGTQGGPLMHVIAGKATAFHEALQPAFKSYQQQVLLNADTLAKTLVERGFRIVSGRTESHVMLVDLRAKGITGKAAELALGQAHITCNKNGIPNDPEKPMVTSGIRLGTPAMTTRGFGQEQARMTANLIADVLEAPEDAAHISNIRSKVAQLVAPFPVYGEAVLHP